MRMRQHFAQRIHRSARNRCFGEQLEPFVAALAHHQPAHSVHGLAPVLDAVDIRRELRHCAKLQRTGPAAKGAPQAIVGVAVVDAFVEVVQRSRKIEPKMGDL